MGKTRQLKARRCTIARALALSVANAVELNTAAVTAPHAATAANTVTTSANSGNCSRMAVGTGWELHLKTH